VFVIRVLGVEVFAIGLGGAEYDAEPSEVRESVGNTQQDFSLEQEAAEADYDDYEIPPDDPQYKVKPFGFAGHTEVRMMPCQA